MRTGRDLLHADTYEYLRVPPDNSNSFSGYKKVMWMVARILLGKSSVHYCRCCMIRCCWRGFSIMASMGVPAAPYFPALISGCLLRIGYHFLQNYWHRFLAASQSGIELIKLTDRNLPVQES